MSVLDDLLAKPPETRSVVFATDQRAAERLWDAKRRSDELLEQADRTSIPEHVSQAAAAKDEYEKLAAEMTGKVIRFTFRSVDPADFDRLKGEYRPTEKQRTDARKLGLPPPEWDKERFSPAFIALACIKIETPSGTQEGISVEDALTLWASDNWNEAEKAELFNTALGSMTSRTRVALEAAKND